MRTKSSGEPDDVCSSMSALIFTRGTVAVKLGFALRNGDGTRYWQCEARNWTCPTFRLRVIQISSASSRSCDTDAYEFNKFQRTGQLLATRLTCSRRSIVLRQQSKSPAYSHIDSRIVVVGASDNWSSQFPLSDRANCENQLSVSRIFN